MPKFTKDLAVCFKGDSNVYYIESPDVIQKCLETCDLDHDHYEEDYICVYQVTSTAKPVSNLVTFFDDNNHGHLIEEL